MRKRDLVQNNRGIVEGVIWKQLLIYFFPILLGTFFQQLYNTVDAVVVGNYLGKEALAAVGMGEFARHAPHLLSGGQKQRIAIAGVLAMEPACIVLDEATAMLDPVGRREVLSAVHKLNREKGITVVLITHHMNEAEDADRVAVMDDGKVIMDGAPRQVFTQVERLRSMGLTVPDTVDLLDRLRKDGLDVPLTALTVEECADAILAAVSK